MVELALVSQNTRGSGVRSRVVGYRDPFVLLSQSVRARGSSLFVSSATGVFRITWGMGDGEGDGEGFADRRLMAEAADDMIELAIEGGGGAEGIGMEDGGDGGAEATDMKGDTDARRTCDEIRGEHIARSVR